MAADLSRQAAAAKTVYQQFATWRQANNAVTADQARTRIADALQTAAVRWAFVTQVVLLLCSAAAMVSGVVLRDGRSVIPALMLFLTGAAIVPLQRVLVRRRTAGVLRRTDVSDDKLRTLLTLVEHAPPRIRLDLLWQLDTVVVTVPAGLDCGYVNKHLPGCPHRTL